MRFLCTVFNNSWFESSPWSFTLFYIKTFFAGELNLKLLYVITRSQLQNYWNPQRIFIYWYELSHSRDRWLKKKKTTLQHDNKQTWLSMWVQNCSKEFKWFIQTTTNRIQYELSLLWTAVMFDWGVKTKMKWEEIWWKASGLVWQTFITLISGTTDKISVSLSRS